MIVDPVIQGVLEGSPRLRLHLETLEAELRMERHHNAVLRLQRDELLRQVAEANELARRKWWQRWGLSSPVATNKGGLNA